MAEAASTGEFTSGSADTAADTDRLFALLVETSRMLTAKYPTRNGPFERVVQLAEETGEIAEQINIWAGRGLKRQKHGEFHPQHLAAEISDVMRAAVGIALEFDILSLVSDEIRARHGHAAEESGIP